jgi:hypothetical protein
MTRPQVKMAAIEDTSSMLAYIHCLVSEVDNNVLLLPDELPSVEKATPYVSAER